MLAVVIESFGPRWGDEEAATVWSSAMIEKT